MSSQIQEEINKCYRQREILISYMYGKIKVEDWHTVADVAMDIRDLESEIKAYKVCITLDKGESK